MNNLKTVGLLAFMSALLGFLVYALGGSVATALILAFGFNFLAFFFSDKMALAASRAQPVTEEQLPQVYGIVRRLSTQIDMPMPSIHVINSPQPNAFATGRSPRKAAVAVTTGILDVLSFEELEGVLAHELAHVKNRDILISSIAAMIGAAISIIVRFTLFFGGGDNRNNSLRHLENQRIPGRRHWRRNHGSTPDARQRLGEDLERDGPDTDAGERVDGAALHRQPAQGDSRRWDDATLQHPPTHRGADRAAHQHGDGNLLGPAMSS